MTLCAFFLRFFFFCVSRVHIAISLWIPYATESDQREEIYTMQNDSCLCLRYTRYFFPRFQCKSSGAFLGFFFLRCMAQSSLISLLSFLQNCNVLVHFRGKKKLSDVRMLVSVKYGWNVFDQSTKQRMKTRSDCRACAVLVLRSA